MGTQLVDASIWHFSHYITLSVWEDFQTVWPWFWTYHICTAIHHTRHGMKLLDLVLCLVFIDLSNNYILPSSLTHHQESTVVSFLICLVIIENQSVVSWLLAQHKVTCSTGRMILYNSYMKVVWSLGILVILYKLGKENGCYRHEWKPSLKYISTP